MSRRKTKKSNTIGIFKDKSREYNLAILRELYSRGAAKAWQLAERIQKKRNPGLTNKAEIFVEKQAIYSVIQRKKGRLEDLAAKGYIEESDGLWMLTLKGNLELSLQQDIQKELESVGSEVTDEAIGVFRRRVETIPDGTIRAPFGLSFDRGRSKEDMLRMAQHIMKNPSVFRALAMEIQNLVDEGIDLDRIDENQLVILLMNTEPVKRLYKAL